MTIKVEREALLRLLGTPPSGPPLDSPIKCREQFDYVSIRKSSSLEEDYPVGKLRERALRDDDSVCTVSTASISSDDDDDEDYDKRVSFAEPLVTEEWTREYTSKDDIANLFYSTEETQRFRQEYRLERKLLSDLAIDPQELPDDSLFTDLVDAKCQEQGRHQISRVVVLHNDKLETFFNTDEVTAPTTSDPQDSDDFFDSDSFWSGSITWW